MIDYAKYPQSKDFNKISNFIIGKSSDLIVIIDEDLKIEFLNEESFQKSLGHFSDDLIGKPFVEIIHSKDRKDTTNALKKLSSITETNWDIRLIHRDNFYKHFKAHGKIFTDEINKKKILIILNEISYRKELQKNLRKSEKRFRELSDSLTELQFWRLFQSKQSITILEETSEMLQLVVDSFPHYVVWKDKNLVYLGCNKNFARIAKIDDSVKIIGKTDYDLSWGEKTVFLLNEREKHVINTANSEYHAQESWFELNGEKRFFDTNRVPIRDLKGKVVGILVTYEDITERRLAEEKLKISEDKYKNMIHNLDLGFCKTDLNGIFLEHNPALNKIIGFSATESLIGLSSLDFWKNPEDIRKYYNELIKKGSLTTYVSKAKKKNGETIVLESNSHLVKNNDNEIIGIESTISDITEKYNLEQKLKESEEKYRLMIANLDVGFFTAGIDGTYLNHNPEHNRILGIDSTKSLKGKKTVDFWQNPEDRQHYLHKLINKGYIKNYTVYAKKVNGENIILQTNAHLIKDDKGENISIEGTFINITEKFSLEKKLKDSEKKYRHLFENSPYGIFLFNPEGNLVDYNDTVFRIFPNSTNTDLHGKNFIEIIGEIKNSEEILKMFMKRRSAKIRGESLDPVEFSIITSEGKQFWVHWESSFIKMGDDIFTQAFVQNITEKKNSERRLKESEEKYRLISENAHDLIVILNEKLEHEYVNVQAYQKILGYSREDVMGKTRRDFIHPDDYQKSTDILKEIFRKGEGTGELRLRHKNGEYVWVETKGRVFKDSENKSKALTLSRNISERKIAERKLRESEEKYRLISENAYDLIFMMNKESIFEYINELPLFKMLGYNKDELIGKTGMQFTHPDDLEKASKAFRKGIKTGVGIVEVRVKHKDGHYIWLETNGKVFNDKGKQKFHVIARNITDRKLTEQKLKESEEKLKILNKELENKVMERTKRLKESEEKHRHLYENSPYGIVLLDLKGKILDINSTIPILFGYGKNDLIGRSYFDLLGIYPEDVIPALRTIPDLMSNGDKFRRKFKPKRVKIYKKDGSISWVDAEISIIKLGEDIIIQAIIQDVTDKKISEEKLKESEKMLRKQNIELRKLDKIKNDFITFAAHELKTPLISISGYTDYILLKHNDVLIPEIKEDLEIVRKNVRRLETFMDQLLDVMKIDEQKLKLYKGVTNTGELIKNCIRELTYQINEKNHKIIVNLEENIVLNVDSERIFQVFTNLLSNAIKFTPENGRIEISAIKKENGYLFSVQDNGIGLSEVDKNRLFRKFEMIKKPFDGNGTGLGLYITKGIIEFHDGEIWVESDGLNRGTSFFFTLPL